ncbi:MAG: caspase family protein, partial [Alphaproteobacteria bacterium]
MMPRGLAALAAFLVLMPGLALANRLALVIGNDGYENLPVLQKAQNDAAAIADRLQGFGYTVTLLRDADRRTITRGLSDLAATIDPGGEVVFYFAGHGVEIQGRNYLIPVDAPAAKPEEAAF